jgi:hypothetical protein
MFDHGRRAFLSLKICCLLNALSNKIAWQKKNENIKADFICLVEYKIFFHQKLILCQSLYISFCIKENVLWYETKQFWLIINQADIPNKLWPFDAFSAGKA